MIFSRTLKTGLFAAALIFAGFFLSFSFANASAQVDDLITCENSPAVYYIAEDGKRYVFPNEAIFFSHYAGFDDVKVISCDDLATLEIGGNVVYQAGTTLVKLVTVPTVYAVESNGVLRPIRDEAQAIDLFGDDWADSVDDLPDAFFPSFTVAAELQEGELPEGMILKDDAENLFRVNDEGDAVEIDEILGDEDNDFDDIAEDLEDVESKLEIDINTIEALTDELIALLDELQRLLETVDVEVEIEIEIELDEVDQLPGDDALEEISDAEKEIAKAIDQISEREADGKDVTPANVLLEEAQSTLDEAQTAFDAEDFDLAEDLAKESKDFAKDARSGREATNSDNEDEADEESTDDETIETSENADEVDATDDESESVDETDAVDDDSEMDEEEDASNDSIDESESDDSENNSGSSTNNSGSGNGDTI